MWAIQRNPYLEGDLLMRPKGRRDVLVGMRRRLDEIEGRRGESGQVARSFRTGYSSPRPVTIIIWRVT